MKFAIIIATAILTTACAPARIDEDAVVKFQEACKEKGGVSYANTVRGEMNVNTMSCTIVKR